MPYSVSRPPAAIDKSKEGSFGASSRFTSVVKSIATTNTAASKPATVKTAITTAKASPGFSVITAVKTAVASAPAIAAKITKTHT